ncbi:MAG: YitT family protein [Eubacteriales bacterium]|nr:YitT family protein [Eubacteriales bacterium]
MKKIKPIFKEFFNQNRKEKIKLFSIDFVCVLIACAFGAFATVSVMIPNGLTSGGLTGVVRIIQNYISMDFSVLYYIGSFIIIAAAGITMGFTEVKKLILISVLYPAVLMFFEYTDFRLLEEKDLILAAIFCGAFSGVCSGIVFWRGYSFSGTDAIAKMIRKKLLPQFSQSKIMVAIDAIVIIISAFIFGRNIALYALVTQVIISKTIDVIIFGFESKIIQLEIITMKGDEITEYIVKEIGRGVSRHTVKGAYTDTVRSELRLLCSPRESISVKRKIAKIDPGAFVTVIKVDNVWGSGKGFGDIDKD